jgi:6-phosphogluconolactonase
MKNFELLNFANADELARAAANAWLEEVESANRANRKICVALSGGRIVQNFFVATVELVRERHRAGVSIFGDGDTPSLPGNIHFFWADERCVPPTDADSNFKEASTLLLEPLRIPPNQIHRLRGEVSPETAVKMANEEIRHVVLGSKPLTPPISPLGQGEGVESLPVLDLIFLGMGEDGHVASLFPNATPRILDSTAPFLAISHSPKPPPNRISLSYAALAAAKQVWALISGAGKAEALRASLNPDGVTPLARVMRSRSQFKIFCDIALD